MDSSLSLTIIAGLLCVITLFLIVALYKAIKALGEIQKLTELVRLQMAPISHDVSQIIGDIRSIVKSAEKNMDKVGDSITAVRDTTRNIRQFETMLQERVERPLLDATTILSAALKGGKIFWTHFRKRNEVH